MHTSRANQVDDTVDSADGITAEAAMVEVDTEAEGMVVVDTEVDTEVAVEAMVNEVAVMDTVVVATVNEVVEATVVIREAVIEMAMEMMATDQIDPTRHHDPRVIELQRSRDGWCCSILKRLALVDGFVSTLGRCLCDVTLSWLSALGGGTCRPLAYSRFASSESLRPPFHEFRGQDFLAVSLRWHAAKGASNGSIRPRVLASSPPTMEALTSLSTRSVRPRPEIVVFVDCSRRGVFLQTSIQSQGFRSLRENEPVEFDISQGEDGRTKAINVTGPNGAEPQVRPCALVCVCSFGL